MNSYFLDTSALVKIYHQEEGTDEVLRFYKDTSSCLYLSELSLIELRSSVYRKLREKELSQEALNAVIDLFVYDCQSKFKVLPVRSIVYEKACELFEHYGDKLGLRSLDSIQHATFLTYCNPDTDFFVSADKQLLNIVQQDNVQVIGL